MVVSFLPLSCMLLTLSPHNLTGTNDATLGKILVRMGGTCNCRGKHEHSVQGTRDTNFAALPMKLCEIISDYVYSKHRQLKLKKYSEGSGEGI